MTRLIVVLLVFFAVARAGAQVGYPPAQSPYLDLGPAQELTAVAGWFHAHRDDAGVAPQSGPLFGLQYEFRAGGPFHLLADLNTIDSKRTIINAGATDTSLRNLGTISLPLFNGDIGMALALPGARSWHHIVPMATIGIGIITDFKGRDTSSFDFGTRFTFTWGMGVRWVPGGHFQLRADLMDHMYTIAYPESFFDSPGTGVPAFQAATVPKSKWTNNPALTIGLSYFY